RDRRRRDLRSARARRPPDQTDGRVDAERLDERDEASEVERPSVATLRGVRLVRSGCSAWPGMGDRLRPEWVFDSAGIRRWHRTRPPRLVGMVICPALR